MNVTTSAGMGLLSIIKVLTIVFTIAKEVLMILLIFKGIQIANVYLRKNKSNKSKTGQLQESVNENLDQEIKN